MRSIKFQTYLAPAVRLLLHTLLRLNWSSGTTVSLFSSTPPSEICTFKVFWSDDLRQGHDLRQADADDPRQVDADDLRQVDARQAGDLRQAAEDRVKETAKPGTPLLRVEKLLSNLEPFIKMIDLLSEVSVWWFHATQSTQSTERWIGSSCS